MISSATRFDRFVDALAYVEAGGLPTRLRSTPKGAFVLEPLRPDWQDWVPKDHNVGAAWFRQVSPVGVKITSLAVYPYWRKRGIGTDLLRALCAAADISQVTLTLTVRPFEGWGYRIPTRREFLASWYSRFGFIAFPYRSNMHRVPGSVPQEIP